MRLLDTRLHTVYMVYKVVRNKMTLYLQRPPL